MGSDLEFFELYQLTKTMIISDQTPEVPRGHLALSKVSAIGCLHPLSREEEAHISMALTTSS